MVWHNHHHLNLIFKIMRKFISKMLLFLGVCGSKIQSKEMFNIYLKNTDRSKINKNKEKYWEMYA